MTTWDGRAVRLGEGGRELFLSRRGDHTDFDVNACDLDAALVFTCIPALNVPAALIVAVSPAPDGALLIETTSFGLFSLVKREEGPMVIQQVFTADQCAQIHAAARA